MMFIGNKIYHRAIITFSCLWSLCAIVSLSGCSSNIPSASSLVSSEVTLSWDEVPGAISYNVYGSTSPGVTKLSGSKFRNVPNPFTITQLQPGKTYYFVVTVLTESGESKESKEMSYTADANTAGHIQFGDIVSPSAPDAADPESEDITPPLPSESALEVSSEQQERQQTPTRSNTKKAKPTVKDAPPKTVDVMLAWDDVPNAISYNIYWSDKPGVTIKNGTKISNVKSPHKISGLIKGKKYYFVVTAVNASVESEESEEMSFTVGQ
ncbi:MAG: fibronectin type III domain-containing protein [Desulfobacterales bacterium]|jgi:fibronectin type 3 domain-containing protein